MAIAVPLVAGGCLARENPLSAEPTPKRTVVIRDGAYHPATVRVRAGSRVTWVNRDTYPITVETDGVPFFAYDRDDLDRRNQFDLHTLSIGEAESAQFDTPGRYPYHSSFDPTTRGTVVVTPDSRRRR